MHGIHRVDSVSELQVALTYMPPGQKQTLAAGLTMRYAAPSRTVGAPSVRFSLGAEARAPLTRPARAPTFTISASSIIAPELLIARAPR